MNKHAPTIGRIAAMAAFTLSVFGLLMFLWVAFGGVLPLKPQGYRFKVAFPQATLLVEEADVRLAGINIGKVKSKELSEDGRRTIAVIEVDSRFAPVPRNTRAILRQKSLLGETYVALSPGSRDSGDLPDGGTLARSQVQDTVQLDQIFGIFDETSRRNFETWLHESGIATSGDYGTDFNNALGNAAPFFEDGADLLRPLAEQQLALRRLVRNTGRTFDAVSAENGALRRLIVGGEATFSALSSRDESLAQTFQILPTFLRETRATVRRLESFARNTDPLVRDLRRPATDLGPTLRDLGDLSPDLERLFKAVHPLVAASRTGVPAAARFLRGAEPLLEAVHVFMPELNPTLAYLNFARRQIGTFFSAPAATLAGTGVGGYTGNGAGEHYLPQAAIIDTRSLMRRSTRPFWERANAYVAPNAYERAIGLGVTESFDCAPNGGEQRDPSGSGLGAEPPCFVAPPLLFGDQKYPKLRRGRAPLVPAPEGRDGNAPASVPPRG
jgi:phospholipid/cholesterol/gamma-HCH transport system substrate-binding protein